MSPNARTLLAALQSLDRPVPRCESDYLAPQPRLSIRELREAGYIVSVHRADGRGYVVTEAGRQALE